MDDRKIARINELYHKSKGVGLTEAEKAEQQALRKEYIAAIRGSIRSTLDNASIENPDGTITPLKMVRRQKMQAKRTVIQEETIIRIEEDEEI